MGVPGQNRVRQTVQQLEFRRGDPHALDLPETIAQIHAQGGLAVASHPHVMKSEWGKNTLYLWENQDRFAPLIDAWEIANRNNLLAPVSLKRLAFIANSDLHKPRHIYSWKALLGCAKDPEASKECIRRNKDVSITLYRDDRAQVLVNVDFPRASGEEIIPFDRARLLAAQR